MGFLTRCHGCSACAKLRLPFGVLGSGARKWLPAFEKTGVVQTAGALTVELEHAGVPRVAQIPFMPPSREDIEAIFPRGRFVPYVSLFWHPARLDPPLLT